MELVPGEELQTSGSNSSQDLRARKIARFMRQRAAEAKLLEIMERKERRGRSTRATTTSSPIELGEEDAFDDDGEEEREAWFTSISLALCKCVEGKPLFQFDRTRMFKSDLVGFMLHGSLSHYYYQFCEFLIPFDDWWVVQAKVAFDQTVWAAIWNNIYFTVVALLRFESPANI